MIKINIIDKEYDFPTSWEEVPFKLGQELMDIENKDLFSKYVESIRLIHPEIDVKLIHQFDSLSFQRLVDKINFLETEPTAIGNKIIEIEGKKYAMVQDVNEITVGEWIDIESIVKGEDVINNLHIILGIVVREVTEETEVLGKAKWKIAPYDGKEALDRAEYFNDNMNVQDGLSYCNFFLILEQMYIGNMMTFLKEKAKKKE